MIIIREYILGHCYKMSKCNTRLSFIMWTWIVSLNVILFTISRYYSAPKARGWIFVLKGAISIIHYPVSVSFD